MLTLSMNQINFSDKAKFALLSSQAYIVGFWCTLSYTEFDSGAMLAMLSHHDTMYEYHSTSHPIDNASQSIRSKWIPRRN